MLRQADGRIGGRTFGPSRAPGCHAGSRNRAAEPPGRPVTGVPPGAARLTVVPRGGRTGRTDRAAPPRRTAEPHACRWWVSAGLSITPRGGRGGRLRLGCRSQGSTTPGRGGRVLRKRWPSPATPAAR